MLRKRKRICSIAGCNLPHKARGLCLRHVLMKYYWEAKGKNFLDIIAKNYEVVNGN